MTPHLFLGWRTSSLKPFTFSIRLPDHSQAAGETASPIGCRVAMANRDPFAHVHRARARPACIARVRARLRAARCRQAARGVAFDSSHLGCHSDVKFRNRKSAPFLGAQFYRTDVPNSIGRPWPFSAGPTASRTRYCARTPGQTMPPDWRENSPDAKLRF